MSHKQIYEKFNKAAELYLADLTTKTDSKATQTAYRQALNKFGKWILSRDAAEQNGTDDTNDGNEVSPVMIVEWKMHITKTEQLKHNTLRYYLIILKAFFAWAVEKRIYTQMPLTDKDIPKAKEVRLSFLSDDEIRLILREAALDKRAKTVVALRKKAIVILLMQSGLRVSELTALQMGDLNFENGSIMVRNGKGGKARSTTFPPFARQIVSEYLSSAYKGNSRPLTAYVFAHEDADDNRPFTRQDITHIVRTYVRKVVGRNDISAHDLRHAYASYLITNGIKLDNIQQLLGHKSYATTVIYAEHLRPKSIPTEVNRVFDVV